MSSLPMLPFDIAAGSVRGCDHERLGRNNQDAFAWSRTDEAVLAVVCDGCGSGQYSEVGARLGTQLVLQALRLWAPLLQQKPAAMVLEQVRLRLLSQLYELIRNMGGVFLSTLEGHFLFTIVGTMITSRRAVVFTLGDGALAINGAYTHLTYPDNAPPYLAYGLIRDALPASLQEHLAFQVHWDGDAQEVQAILIGSDGVDDLQQAAGQCLPGKSEPVGALAQFWHEERYFANAFSMTRRLALINRTVTRYDWEQQRVYQERGLLADDTTLIVIRRKPPCQGKG